MLTRVELEFKKGNGGQNPGKWGKLWESLAL